MSKINISTFNSSEIGGGDKALTLSEYISNNLYKTIKEFNFLNEQSEAEIEDIINNIITYDKNFYILYLMYNRKKNKYEDNTEIPIITNKTTNYNHLIPPNLKIIIKSPQTINERLTELDNLNDYNLADVKLSLKTKINNLLNSSINTTIKDKIGSIKSECTSQINNNSEYKDFCNTLLSDVEDIESKIDSYENFISSIIDKEIILNYEDNLVNYLDYQNSEININIEKFLGINKEDFKKIWVKDVKKINKDAINYLYFKFYAIMQNDLLLMFNYQSDNKAILIDMDNYEKYKYNNKLDIFYICDISTNKAGDITVTNIELLKKYLLPINLTSLCNRLLFEKYIIIYDLNFLLSDTYFINRKLKFSSSETDTYIEYLKGDRIYFNIDNEEINKYNMLFFNDKFYNTLIIDNYCIPNIHYSLLYDLTDNYTIILNDQKQISNIKINYLGGKVIINGHVLDLLNYNMLILDGDSINHNPNCNIFNSIIEINKNGILEIFQLQDQYKGTDDKYQPLIFNQDFINHGTLIIETRETQDIIINGDFYNYGTATIQNNIIFNGNVYNYGELKIFGENCKVDFYKTIYNYGKCELTCTVNFYIEGLHLLFNYGDFIFSQSFNNSQVNVYDILAVNFDKVDNKQNIQILGDEELIINYRNLFIDTPFNLISRYIEGSSHSYDDENYINQVYLYTGTSGSNGRIRRAQAAGTLMRFFINTYINNINRGVCVFTDKFKNIGHLNIALYVKNDGLVINYSLDHLFGRFSTLTDEDNNIILFYNAFFTYEKESSNILTVLKDISDNIIITDIITTDPTNENLKAPNFIYSSGVISSIDSIYSGLLENLRDCENISFYKNFLNYSNNTVNLNNELRQLVKSSLTKNNANIIKNLTTDEVNRQPLLNTINKINNYPLIRENDLKILLYLLNDNTGTATIPTINIPDYTDILNNIKGNTETLIKDTIDIKNNNSTIIDKLDNITELINNIFTNNEEGGLSVDSSTYSVLNILHHLLTNLQTEINDIKSSISNGSITNNLTVNDIINELKKTQTEIENYFNYKFNNIQGCQCSPNNNIISIDSTDIINKIKPLISELKTLLLLLSTNDKQHFPYPQIPLRQQNINPQPMTYNPNIF